MNPLSLIVFFFQTIPILTYNNIKITAESSGDEVLISGTKIKKDQNYNFDLNSKQMEIQIKTRDDYFGSFWASLDFKYFKATTNEILLWKHGNLNEECSSKQLVTTNTKGKNKIQVKNDREWWSLLTKKICTFIVTLKICKNETIYISNDKNEINFNDLNLFYINPDPTSVFVFTDPPDYGFIKKEGSPSGATSFKNDKLFYVKA